MSTQTVTIVVTVSLAFIGYIITHQNNLSLARRREKLELIDAQLNQFYGPLYIIATVGRIEYWALIRKMGRLPEGELEKPLAPQEFIEWRLWMTEVFMPMNIWCEKLLLEHAYLLREAKLPDCIIRFFTHVAAYKPVLKKWSDNDFTEQFSIIDFPTDLEEYAEASYRALKAEQLRLIGLTT